MTTLGKVPGAINAEAIGEEETMGEQQSQKRGLKSEAQKEDRAREAYATVPPSNPVRGAFGGTKNKPPSDSSASVSRKTGKQTGRHAHKEAKK